MTLNLKKLALGPLVALALGAAPAVGAVVTFDLRGDDTPIFSELKSKATLSEDKLDASFNARRFRFLEVTDGAITKGSVRNSRIGRFEDGAGVMSRRQEGAETGVDGLSNRNNWFDFIEMTFTSRGRDVKVSGLAFTFANIGEAARGTSNADAYLAADTDDSGRIRVGDSVSPIFQASTLPTALTGPDLFGGNVYGLGAGLGASWTLQSVQVTYTPVVPLPAGGLLLLTGLGGLAVARRRKRAA